LKKRHFFEFRFSFFLDWAFISKESLQLKKKIKNEEVYENDGTNVNIL